MFIVTIPNKLEESFCGCMTNKLLGDAYYFDSGVCLFVVYLINMYGDHIITCTCVPNLI